MGQRMRRLRKSAGIQADANGEELVLYHHRHTYITEAASIGTDGPMLRTLAGHTDPRTTERYAHLANQTIVTAGVRVSAGLKPQRPGK